MLYNLRITVQTVFEKLHVKNYFKKLYVCDLQILVIITFRLLLTKKTLRLNLFQPTNMN